LSQSARQDYECGGGSEVEFFAAQGSYSSFNASFRLVGDAAGLAVKSLPGSASSTTLRPLIATDVVLPMYGRSSSAYMRAPFTVADPSVFSSLTLRVEYNDGFAAYLNGTKIASRNIPATPVWNSVATAARSAASALAYEEIDVTGNLGLLRAGANVLALHGVNESASGAQFLVLAELVENKLLGSATNHYFATPTPGTYNADTALAFVDDLKFSPDRGWFQHTNFSVTSTPPMEPLPPQRTACFIPGPSRLAAPPCCGRLAVSTGSNPRPSRPTVISFWTRCSSKAPT
jgi:hypothetical protein